MFVLAEQPVDAPYPEATAYGEDVSARGRIDAWRTGLNIAKERPFTGVGAGAFMIAWPEFAPGDAGPVRTQHNTFMQLLSELGIPALVLFLGALLAGALRHASRGQARVVAAAVRARHRSAGLAGFAVCSHLGRHRLHLADLLALGHRVRRASHLVHARLPRRSRSVEDTVVSPMPQPGAAPVGR